MATPALYTALRTRLAEEARAAFDKALEDAVHLGSHLAERGDAALLLMRKCGSLRRDDLAIRQLAGARQNGELDLYRRLLIRFALELETQEGVLDGRVKRHIAAVRQEIYSKTIGRKPVSVLKRKAGQPTQRPLRMALKTNRGLPVEEGSGKKFAELPCGRVRKSSVRDVVSRSNPVSYGKSMDLGRISRNPLTPNKDKRRKAITENQRRIA